MIRCPLCQSDTKVTDTRGIERRRECVSCKHRFSTAEILKAELERSERIIREAQELAERIRRAA